MFFEQYSHEPCIAVARHWIQHVEMTESQRAQLPEKQEGGRAALAVMEGHLAAFDWFGGHAMSIADIALYAYTHVADEGGFDLSGYPRVGDWLRPHAGTARTCPHGARTGGDRRPGRRLRRRSQPASGSLGVGGTRVCQSVSRW